MDHAQDIKIVDDQSAEAAVTLHNELGLHARAATLLAQTAEACRCKVEVTRQDRKADAQSVMQLLMLAAVKGDELTIRARGKDAAATVAAVVDLIRRGFDE
jgi:phosphotransferase system HPr (HPr) family protein